MYFLSKFACFPHPPTVCIVGASPPRTQFISITPSASCTTVCGGRRALQLPNGCMRRGVASKYADCLKEHLASEQQESAPRHMEEADVSPYLLSNEKADSAS